MSRSGAVAVLVLFIIIGAIFDKGFIHLDNLRNIAFSASYIGLITAGMTFVIISGGIDLSVGSVFALGVLTSAFMSRVRVVLGDRRPAAGAAVRPAWCRAASSPGCGCHRSS